MPRKALYPEGSQQLNVIVPSTVKAAVNRVAERRRQSTSQLVAAILETWAQGQGELRKRDEVTV
jgi:hypothetical protein